MSKTVVDPALLDKAVEIVTRLPNHHFLSDEEFYEMIFTWYKRLYYLPGELAKRIAKSMPQGTEGQILCGNSGGQGIEWDQDTKELTASEVLDVIRRQRAAGKIDNSLTAREVMGEIIDECMKNDKDYFDGIIKKRKD